MNVNPEMLFGGTMLLGLLAAFWAHAKALTWRLATLMVDSVAVGGSSHGHQARPAVEAYLWRAARRGALAQRYYTGYAQMIRPLKRQAVVLLQHTGFDAAVWWLHTPAAPWYARWRPLLVRTAQAQGAGRNEDGGEDKALILMTVRGLVDLEALLKTAVDEYNASAHACTDSRFSVTRLTGTRGRSATPGRGSQASAQAGLAASPRNSNVHPVGWRPEDIGALDPPDPLGALAYPPEVESVLEDVRRWYEGREWYQDRRIAWQLGLALFGIPGTGKTSFAKAIAQKFGLPVFQLEIATMDDRDLIEAWKTVTGSTPCMALIEDVDTVFEGRTNVMALGDTPGLSFGCLLNCVQGVEGSDGVLFVITTNRVETVDPALGAPVQGTDGSTRPGRIHRAVEFGPLSEACRRRVAARVLDLYPDEIEPAVRAGAGETGAQFVDRCVRRALTRFWAAPDTRISAPPTEGDSCPSPERESTGKKPEPLPGPA